MSIETPGRTMAQVVSRWRLTSETSVYTIQTTYRYILEGCHLHTRSCEKLKARKNKKLVHFKQQK